MTAPAFLSTAQVAARLQYDTPAAFLRQRDRLEEDHAFPLPLPLRARRRPLWRADAIDAWLAAQCQPRALADAPRPRGPNVYLMEEARRA